MFDNSKKYFNHAHVEVIASSVSAHRDMDLTREAIVTLAIYGVTYHDMDYFLEEAILKAAEEIMIDRRSKTKNSI